MADARFDRAAFSAALATRRLARTLLVRAETGSTNDDAFDAVCAGVPDGVTVVADAQARGRGRAGRAWTHAPGLGLAMSFALHPGCDARQAAVVPLAAGLAVARAAGALGVRAAIKWPNDVLARGRKLAGVLCELRRAPAGGEVVVVGVGVNVRQRAGDFPPELRGTATSFALEGSDASVEAVAARVADEFEPLWTTLQEGDRSEVLDAWSERAAFWGETVTVNAPGGAITGVAQRLDCDGALVLRLESGVEAVVVAGDVEPAGPAAERPR
ncbi:MAG: biotin--[acetyl-CoA-carboxylase] ligase [Candidatus Eisenbacteria bacterium]|nr:biotin--[acetyl-CoA-carboxylase] ligase [Candidatus Eisenbacteria bacterium]